MDNCRLSKLAVDESVLKLLSNLIHFQKSCVQFVCLCVPLLTSKGISFCMFSGIFNYTFLQSVKLCLAAIMDTKNLKAEHPAPTSHDWST